MANITVVEGLCVLVLGLPPDELASVFCSNLDYFLSFLTIGQSLVLGIVPNYGRMHYTPWKCLCAVVDKGGWVRVKQWLCVQG